MSDDNEYDVLCNSPLYDPQIFSSIIEPYINDLKIFKILYRFFNGPHGQSAKFDNNIITICYVREINPEFWVARSNDVIKEYGAKYYVKYDRHYMENYKFYYCYSILQHKKN